MLDSRLGAACTFGLLLMLGIIAIETFGTDNLLVIKGLVPAITLRNEINSTNTTDTSQFKLLNITVETYAPFSNIDCNHIVLEDSNQYLKCKTNISQEMKWDDTAIFCNLHMSCNVSGSIRGTNTVDVEFPDNFQNIKWSVSTSVWYSGNKYNMSGLASSFGPSGKSKSLIGTTTKPTKLSFGVVRSKFINNIQQANKIFYGIQMSFLGLTKEENELGTDDGKHHVAFEFDVEESVYVKEHSDKVVLLTRIASMFALLLSAMSGMKFGKTYLQLVIDTCFFKCKKKRDVPEDVLRRERVLDEHNLTAKGTRRLSSVGNVLMGLKNMQDKDKNTDADAETVMNIKKPKKKRRLSSRELIEEQNMMSNPMPKKKTAASSVIEMTELSLASSPRSANSSDIIEVKEENQKLRLELVELRDEMESKLYDQEQEAIRQKKEMAKMESRFTKQQQQINDLMTKVGSISTDPKIEIMVDDTSTDPKIQIIVDEKTGRRYSYCPSSGETVWVDKE